MKSILSALLLLSICVHSSAQQLQGIKIEELSTYINKADHPLVINFWATWCKPCIAEIPYVQQAAQQYKDSFHQNLMQPILFDVLKEIKQRSGEKK